MHIFLTTLFAALALLWTIEAIDIALGVPSIPDLAKTPPLEDSRCPTVSILFAARDEAAKLPGALGTFLALDYPRYEIVAVDDRSEDATGAILEAAAQEDARLKFMRIDSLPSGWLGKPHALQKAYEQSSGEWLVFTDADVHFAPDLLRRSVALAKEKRWDHLTLLGAPQMFSFGEKIVMIFFGLGFVIGARPWGTSNPKSSAYMGIGAFQMIHRSGYETMGTHKRLAMEVVDDMKLGKIAKEAGLRSGVAKAGYSVSVHWQAGVRNIIRGTTKNFFATCGFRLWLVVLQVCAVLLLCVLPAAALPFLHGWALIFDMLCVGVTLILTAGVAIEFKASPLFALTYPLGAVIFAWMMVRSTIVTLWRGGVVWRGTFYPIEELRRGVV